MLELQAWRQDRLDLAKLMLAKLKTDPAELEPTAAEELADTLFEIGRRQTEKSQWVDAVYWLEKAYDLLSNQSLEALSNDSGELQISIMHTMARAFLNLEGENGREQSWNILQKLDIDCGDRLAVLLLKLDHFATNPVHSPQDYNDVLLKIIRTVHLTDTNVKTILHHVHKLKVRSPQMAHTVLAVFLSERLLSAEQPKWLEKALVTIIWNCTTSTGTLDIHNSLGELFDSLAAASSMPLSPSATHAAQILLWKRIETSYNQEFFDATEAWCRLSLHALLGNSGALNIGKLQRKLILCALGTSDPAKALEVYSQMSATNRKDPSTQYLLYKVALRSQDVDLATECLDTVFNASANDATLLYACVLEAQQMGDQVQSIASIQRLLEKYNYNAPREVHLPALLRCTARLLIREIDNPDTLVKNGIDGICKLFEGAAVRAKASKRDPANDLFSLAELDWFSRNSYNLALKFCTSWAPGQTLRLSQACLKFLDLYPTAIDPSVAADLSLRRLFCQFLSGSLLIVLARAVDNIQDQVVSYIAGVDRHTLT